MKGKMKKLLSILIMAAMVMALAGCAGGSKGGDGKDSGTEKETKKSFKVGYANKTLNNPYFVALDAALKEDVEALGWEYASLTACRRDAIKYRSDSISARRHVSVTSVIR